MFNIIRYDVNGQAPQVTINTKGGMRIRYHVVLLRPGGDGEIVKEWRGNNWDTKEDRFDMPIKGEQLKFAPLSWQFDVFPNPGVSGERFRINFDISQDGQIIFSKEYEKADVSTPEILTEDGVFVG